MTFRGLRLDRKSSVIAYATLLALSVLFAAETRCSAAVTYDTIGSIYSQNFDTLPNSPTNASLGNSPAGWRDDFATPGPNNFSIVGWYLYHSQTPTEGGFNDHQRMRIGDGGSNTGAFWSFGANGSTDRAMGSLPSATTQAFGGSQYIGLRLTNMTGVTLNDFTLTYNGEQWKDDAANNPLVFEYSTVVNDSTWNGDLGFTPVTELNFAPPVSGGSGGAIDGNTAGRVGITHTVTGVNWAPGGELWLRWSHLQAGVGGGGNIADDGLAIDDLTFSAVEGTPGGGNNILSVQSGSAHVGATWSNSQPPSGSNFYFVQDTHTVDVSSDFVGQKLTVESGGAVNISTSGVNIPWLAINEGASLTMPLGGDFVLGNIDAVPLNILELNEDVTLNLASGQLFGLAMDLTGEGNIDINQTNSVFVPVATAQHGGKIRFNGTGGEVQLLFEEGFFDLELNSPGATLVYDPSANLDNSTETLTVNEAATVRHISTTNRLQGARLMFINAATTFDLTTPFGAAERRWLTSGRLEGSAPITINGTASAPVGVDVNEFEIGSQGTTENEPNNLITSNYSGTITLNNYVNFELRHNLPSGSFVIGNHAILDMGHMKRAAANSIRVGEIEVLSGGTLEVGMEMSDPQVNNVDGHFAYHLRLTNEGGKSGDLIMHDGAQLNMQINGTALTDYDRITAIGGDVQLNGTLRIFVNPASCIGNPANSGCSLDPALANPTFDPATHVGTSWDIIATAPTSAVGDYNNDGNVDDMDYDTWRQQFGTTSDGADGNNDNAVDAADYVVWRKMIGATGTEGLITGTFDSVVDDLAGYHFDVEYLPGIVRITLATGDSGGFAVPEPATVVLIGMLMPLATFRRHRREVA